ncbi:putative short-subunit dehydrogenase-like oxidoreductase (DUF2520 family) [Motilibacter peucedani]|uniref:Putative short-subunit dehydrogenase-like oxidoreductase (DUF2520 family) n=1 Tax=Motilibacter peucedani TaxID=598650 RepID=A0A420XPR6_9ACTN|nr:DUF2520 domain-containing protein [Motilibacter peucedani]RKS75259.1 putative short-subunit dehydrogenase-like oxidoreductase (DUF2520 family) [Motilibacter peucedani]
MPLPASPAARARPARLDVGVVGTGRAGAVIGAALGGAGHRVVAASGVSEASRSRAAALLPGVPLLPPADVVSRAGLAVLAVPDDELAPLARGLAEVGAVRPGTLLVHLSGRHGVGVLQPAVEAGALPLAIHPAMTFTGTPVDLSRLAGCPFAVTAPEPLVPIGQALVVEMGGEPQGVPESLRPLYHAALAGAANSLVTLVAQSLDLLVTCGIEQPARFVAPLLSAALDGALRNGDLALTGPVARGDAGTVASHVHELGLVSPEAAAAYVALARLTADRALAAGVLAPERAEPLLDVLAGRAR